MMSRDIRHVFSPKEIKKLNNGAMLPGNFFALICGSYLSFRKYVMKTNAEYNQGKLLRDCFKSGKLPRNISFTIAWYLFLYKGKLWIPRLHLQQEILKTTHDHPLTSHLDREKLLDLVARSLS